MAGVGALIPITCALSGLVIVLFESRRMERWWERTMDQFVKALRRWS